MTREEAIAIFMSADWGWLNEEEKEAFRMAIEALSKDIVMCSDCEHLDVRNTKNVYAICGRRCVVFRPFEDDTRTHFCAWGERKKP